MCSIIEGYLEWSFTLNAIGMEEENVMQVPNNSSVPSDYYEALRQQTITENKKKFNNFLGLGWK